VSGRRRASASSLADLSPAQACARQLPHGAPLILVYPFAPAMQRCAAVWSPRMMCVCVCAGPACETSSEAFCCRCARALADDDAAAPTPAAPSTSSAHSGTATVTPSRRHAPLGRKQTTAYFACRPCAASNALLRSAAPLLTLSAEWAARISSGVRFALRCCCRRRCRPAFLPRIPRVRGSVPAARSR
jgi:hypothetical protein